MWEWFCNLSSSESAAYAQVEKANAARREVVDAIVYKYMELAIIERKRFYESGRHGSPMIFIDPKDYQVAQEVQLVEIFGVQLYPDPTKNPHA